MYFIFPFHYILLSILTFYLYKNRAIHVVSVSQSLKRGLLATMYMAKSAGKSDVFILSQEKKLRAYAL